MSQTLTFEPVLAPALATFIAFGVITVAANALANFAGTKIHDRKPNNSGDHEFFYDSDSAQKLRECLYRFPSLMTGIYFIFLGLVILFGWIALSGIQSQQDMNSIIVFIPVTALAYMVIVVVLTSCISRKLFKVFQETQGP